MTTFCALFDDTKIVVIVGARLSQKRALLWIVFDFYFCVHNLLFLTQKNTICQKRFFAEISEKFPFRANFIYGIRGRWTKLKIAYCMIFDVLQYYIVGFCPEFFRYFIA